MSKSAIHTITIAVMACIIACNNGSDKRGSKHYANGTIDCCFTHYSDSSIVEGWIDSERTAIKVADAYLSRYYSEKKPRPQSYKARFENDSIWIVYGVLPGGGFGGTLTIELRPDGKVIEFYHGM